MPEPIDVAHSVVFLLGDGRPQYHRHRDHHRCGEYGLSGRPPAAALTVGKAHATHPAGHGHPVFALARGVCAISRADALRPHVAEARAPRHLRGHRGALLTLLASAAAATFGLFTSLLSRSPYSAVRAPKWRRRSWPAIRHSLMSFATRSAPVPPSRGSRHFSRMELARGRGEMAARGSAVRVRGVGDNAGADGHIARGLCASGPRFSDAARGVLAARSLFPQSWGR